MVSLELISGQRQWEINIAGISKPWVAGDWVFVVSDDAKLLCVNRANGKVRWITQLPAFRNEKKKAGPIRYRGPVLAGGRLILASTEGTLINVDPTNGGFQSQTNIRVFGQPVAHRRESDAVHPGRRRAASRLSVGGATAAVDAADGAVAWDASAQARV